MPIESFDISSYRPEQYALLEYMVSVADKVVPDFASDSDGNMYAVDSQAPHIFMRRYNNHLLNVNFTHNDYIHRVRNEENLIDIIEGLGIDVDKFWYLLLFVSDYVAGSTDDTIKLKDSPKQEIEKFVSFVEKNISDFNQFTGFSFAESMTLSLRVKGHKLEIENPNTIAAIASFCKDSLPAINPHSMLNSVDFKYGHKKSGSIKIWLFTHLMRLFFELYPQFGGKKKSKNGVTRSILLLISKLVYFTGLTMNEDYNISDENIKAISKQYHTFKLDTLNTIYG